MIQEKFDQAIDLIRQYVRTFPFLQDLLDVYRTSTLVFSFFNTPLPGNTRQNILEQFEMSVASTYARKNGSNTSAYLLDSLRKTLHAHICVSVFITEVGTFTVFSDFERVDMIGALFSAEAPEEVPYYSHLFMNGELLSRER